MAQPPTAYLAPGHPATYPAPPHHPAQPDHSAHPTAYPGQPNHSAHSAAAPWPPGAASPVGGAPAAHTASGIGGAGQFLEAGAGPAGPVDLNVASAEELAGLPGMDLALAQRAVAERQRRRGFADAEDFGRTLGLAPHQIVRLRDQVVAGPLHGSPPGPRRSPGPPETGPRIVDT
ncbi:MAG: hypothetical protein GEV11_09400 [Streptosporangiales bacterium]|nr:hypothetical protein [Streptosporangiales bacterium]